MVLLFNRPIYRYYAKKKFKSVQHSYNDNVKIELGAGEKKGGNGWITVDINNKCDIYWDLRCPLPFPNFSVDMIYSSHLLEHFYYKDLEKLLNECFRILKKGGAFSTCVPNARIYIEKYMTGAFDYDKYLQYRPAVISHSKIDIVNYIAYMDGHHRHMFDENGLVELLKHANFINITIRDFDPEIDSQDRQHGSLYAVGYK
jgi:predicted SAM-dependent methyltransferase